MLGWLLNLGFAAGASDVTYNPWIPNSNQLAEGKMLKNVAGQNITALLLDTNGAAVTTGTTTVYVTGDAGTQASMGTATHEGNGCWSIDVTQAESNYDDIGFTWVNAGAVTVHQHVFTDQSYDRLGAPAGASVSADIATIDSNVDSILTDTGTTLPGTLTTIEGKIDTVDTVVDGIQTDLDNATDGLGAIKTAIDGQNNISVADILTTQMTESYASDGTAPTLAQALFLIQQTIGDFAISGTTISVKKLDGTTEAATYTLDDGTSPTSRTRAT